jgi:hypothetical protein
MRAPALTKLNRREADMLADIDYSNLPKFPQKLAEKLKQIRGRAGLTPEEFVRQVTQKTERPSRNMRVVKATFRSQS